ncbi:MAG: GGDEF domain-containing protein [Spirochaetes bacterium]|nr:GGDEF domain-containing protein [Spirochaetota bacterium]
MISKAQFLKNVELFSLLSDDEIERIIKSLHTNEFEPDHVLFEEGDEGNELFIVMSGKVASYVVLPNGNKREIAEFRPGDFFGEMSIFENTERSATCYTKEKSTLLSLRERDLFEIILYHPELAVKLMYKMLNVTTERLLDRSEFLSDMVQWGEEARRRAITDELTGIYNRRFLDDALEDYFERSVNSGKPLSLIMIDIDHFREYSENLKQGQVDKIILKVASVFKEYFRDNDIISRYGGDEFTVIMPDTEIGKAYSIADSICKAIHDMDISGLIPPDFSKITVSQGIANYPENADDLETLKTKADKALYKAKSEGRNRVITAD